MQSCVFEGVIMCRLVLVTGGARGIGREISIAFKRLGYDVAATYCRNKDEAEAFSKQFEIPVFAWDVSDYEACVNGVKSVEEICGRSVDILINNAGITADRMMHKMDEDSWNRVIYTNLTSVFNMCHAVITSMRNNKFGRIINISSVNGLKGQLGQTNYSAAKAGIIGFTKSLALESADKGITVNAIAPGYVETDMTSVISESIRQQIIETIPLKRFATPSEIADVAVFLASAAFITGETININGGQYMS